MERNIFFTLASNSKDGQLGLRPTTNKLERFNIVVPDFKLKRFFFPIDKKHTPAMKELLLELSQAAVGGFRSKHDDGLDTISQLALLNVWLPSNETTYVYNSGIWSDEEEINSSYTLDSYTV